MLILAVENAACWLALRKREIPPTPCYGFTRICYQRPLPAPVGAGSEYPVLVVQRGQEGYSFPVPIGATNAW